MKNINRVMAVDMVSVVAGMVKAMGMEPRIPGTDYLGHQQQR